MPERSDFWSRRRRAVAAEEDRATRRSAEAEAEAAAAALEERSDADLLEMLGLPDPEALTPAEAARFMAREVPARLRRRAIRHLFRAHPHLSMPDGLQDYDHDYTDAAVNVRPDPGAWADLRDRAGRLAERLSEPGQEAAEADAVAGDAPPDPPETEAGAGAAAPSGVPPAADAAPIPAAEEEEDLPPRPRRMTFRFDEEST